MKQLSGRAAATLLLTGLVAGGEAAKFAGAAPIYSPSVRQAIRLKYRPPANYLRHYLGEDRYKIAGGTWRVLSTQMDNRYHRASCPNMLRQSPGIVIGFSSAQDAQESGYRPDGLCAPEYSSFTYAPGGSSSSSMGGGNVTTVNRGRTAQRITLADGVSTVLLPPNWRRTQSGAANFFGLPVQSDTLRPLGRRGYIRFLIGDAPNGMNAEQILQPETLRSMLARGGQSGAVNNQLSSIVSKMTIGRARLGGLSGVALTIKPGQQIQGYTGRYIAVARGSRIYQIDDEGKGIPGRALIVTSFRPG